MSEDNTHRDGHDEPTDDTPTGASAETEAAAGTPVTDSGGRASAPSGPTARPPTGTKPESDPAAGGDGDEAGGTNEAGRLWADATASTEHPTGSEAGEPDEPGESGADGAVRREHWSCPGPADLDLSVEVGRIEVALTEGTSVVEVELRAEPSAADGWHKGVAGVLNWLNEAASGAGSIRIGGRQFTFGGPGFPFGPGGSSPGSPGPFSGPLGHGQVPWGGDFFADAVHAAEVSWSEPDRRLVVHSAQALPARLVPLAVTVRAPAGSQVTLRTGAGQLTVTGTAGRVDARSGSGDVQIDTVRGDLRLRTGSGTATVHSVGGRTTAKTGSGTIELARVDGPADLRSGSGDLRLGAVRADLLARAGSGDLTIADAEAGRLDLTTGSGNLRVGVHAGVCAELDLRSGSGHTRSELEVTDTGPPSGEPTLRIYGQTGNGDVLVTRAAG